MASPVELTKLGLKARLRNLGSLKYILIAGLLALVLGGIEIVRYNVYQKCVSDTTGRDIRNYFLEQVTKNVTPSPEDFSRHSNAIETKVQIKCRSDYPYDVFRWWSSLLTPITEANAQMRVGAGAYSESDIRGIVIISIFSAMGIFFFLSVAALFFSKSPNVVAFAMDSVKTLLGFFIGVAATFMGVH